MFKIMLYPIVLLLVNLSSNANLPGLIESYQKLLTAAELEYERAYSKANLTPQTIEQAKELINPQISDYQVQMILFHSDINYWKNSPAQSKCHFYQLISSGIINNKKISNKEILIEHTIKKDQRRLAIFTFNQFLETLVKNDCPDLYLTHKKFKSSSKTVLSETQKLIKPIPLEITKCKSFLRNIQNNSTTAYSCAIQKKIKNNRSSKIEKSIGQDQLMRLNQICEGVKSPSSFCKKRNTNFNWKQIASINNNEYLKNFCKLNLNQKSITNSDFIKCLDQMDNQPDICHQYSPAQSSLFPSPNCKELTIISKISRLKPNYADCPAIVRNDSYINLARIINYFDPPLKSKKDCFSYTGIPMEKLANKTDFENIWNVRLCHKAKDSKEEKCWITNMSKSHGDRSIANTISKIVNRSLSSNAAKLKCVTKYLSEYKKERLEYSAGCYAVLNPKSCSLNDCPISTFINGEKFPGIYLKTKILVEYMASDYKKEGFSLNDIFKRNHNKKERLISNFRILSDTFEQKPSAIVHGQACLEDLYPRFFYRNALNQCQLIPFIIDGLIKLDDKTFKVSLRSSIDGIQSPRLVNWNNLFEALKNLQSIHPSQKWSLYALF